MNRGQVYAALLAVWLLWGSTFLSIRVLVGQVPPLLAAGGRFTVAGAVLFLAVGLKSMRSEGPGVREQLRGRIPRLVLLGVLHFVVANGMVSLAEQRLESGTTGVLFATVPLWLIGVRALSGHRPRAVELCAGAVGLGGVALLLGFRTGPLGPSLMVLAAACAWAVAGFLAERPERRPNPAPPAGAALASAVQMLSGGVVLLLCSLVSGEWAELDPDRVRPTAWLAGIHLILFGSLVGFWAYTWLVTRIDARLAATYAYVQPVITMFLGWLLLGEHLTGAGLGGTALIIVAVAWMVLTRSRDGVAKAKPRPDADDGELTAGTENAGNKNPGNENAGNKDAGTENAAHERRNAEHENAEHENAAHKNENAENEEAETSP
ncbi:EamA family transporter [Streptomyces sp. NBRC 110611]|uniref:EamA family transporter n=1 Tax=Streptomyces sp. NBRC 110611 TaxID=1621259 RepID=UPI0015EEFB87|nr:EamA family transporter [Streptomyces sp. NBRC 110611]